MGDGTEERRKHPIKVKSLQTEYVKSVSCGAHCTAAIAEPRENDGTSSGSRLWIWGQNQVDFVSSFYSLFPIFQTLTFILNMIFLPLFRDQTILVYIGEPLLQIRYSNALNSYMVNDYINLLGYHDILVKYWGFLLLTLLDYLLFA